MKTSCIYNLRWLIPWILAVACTSSQPIQHSDADANVYRYHLTEVDRFGSVYLINQENEVVKYDEGDEQVGYYSNNTLGDIGFLDATNPLKLMLFYPAFYKAVFLDRQLRETSQVDFLELGLGEVRAVATATNGSLWIFDYNQQLLRNIDQQGNVLVESNNLRLTLGRTIDVVKMKQWGEAIYLLTKNGELLKFDLFGYFQSRLGESDMQDFQVVDRSIYFLYADRVDVLLEGLVRPVEVPGWQGKHDAKILLSAAESIRVDKSGYRRQRY